MIPLKIILTLLGMNEAANDHDERYWYARKDI